ncbi:MAG: 2-hydroxyacid dehydrogenase [Ignavibacteria bacterium]
MNILFLFTPNDRWNEHFQKLKSEFPETEFTAVSDPEGRLEALKTADAVVSGRLTESEVNEALKLKAVIVPFTGLNNFPVDVLERRNILIFNTHANAPFVAEHAFSLALALLGRIPEFHDDLKKGIWSRSHESEDLWTTIRGKTIGIAGLGHIGLNIAKYAKAFDCKVLGLKRNTEKKKIENVDELTGDIKYFAETGDVIFAALPLSDTTKNMFDWNILKEMKGKYLVNVGRGDTVNEEALYRALKEGILAGAALDVWYKYPGKNPEPVYPANLPFWELPNVLFSPHKSSHTPEAVNAMIDDTVNNIRKAVLLLKEQA